MLTVARVQLLLVAVTIPFLAACSGSGTSILAPEPTAHQASEFSRNATAINGLNIFDRRRQRNVGHFSCPKKGAIEYVSDSENSVINVYVGPLAGQAPCGQITAGLFEPVGLYVDVSTHDLYVADPQDSAILVFHKGQTAAYNSYVDPTGQLTVWVTIGKDGTIIATNAYASQTIEKGSISTWRPGPNGGTFVGNFPMTNSTFGGNLTVKRDGTIYYVQESLSNTPTLWHVSCPAGACGAETPVAGVTDPYFVGMLFDNTGDLLLNDQFNDTVDTFELPNPQPLAFFLSNREPGSMALDVPHMHWFDTEEDGSNQLTYAVEYTYPAFTLVGSTPGASRAFYQDVAVDPYPNSPPPMNARR